MPIDEKDQPRSLCRDDSRNRGLSATYLSNNGEVAQPSPKWEPILSSIRRSINMPAIREICPEQKRSKGTLLASRCDAGGHGPPGIIQFCNAPRFESSRSGSKAGIIQKCMLGLLDVIPVARGKCTRHRSMPSAHPEMKLMNPSLSTWPDHSPDEICAQFHVRVISRIA